VSGSLKKGAEGSESATLLLLKDMGHVKDLNLICLVLLDVNPKLKIIGADYIGECISFVTLLPQSTVEPPRVM
jgi:hypothetical protein